MPILKPRMNEKRDSYLNRCIPNEIDAGKDPGQATAICESTFDNFVKTTKIFELVTDGIDRMSLVDVPAIEVDFLCFKKEVIKDKQVITGPCLIPNQLILRQDPVTEEYFYVFFTPETVEKIAEEFLLNNKQDAFNLEHTLDTEGITTIESWIVRDPENDKAKALGFDVPRGTWMISAKVSNNDVWNELIKTGTLKGFSIEGYFNEAFTARTTKLDTGFTKDIILIDELIELSKKLEFSLTHNSIVKDTEPDWGTIDKNKLPDNAFADPTNRSYPHHWVVNGKTDPKTGRYVTGDMYLHKGGLNAAWAAANGAHTGKKASANIMDHLQKHRKALGSV